MLTHAQCQAAATAYLVIHGHRLVFDEAVWDDWRLDVVALGRRQIVAAEIKVSKSDFLKDFSAPTAIEARASKAAARYLAADKACRAAELALAARAQALDLVAPDGHPKHEGRATLAYVSLPEFAALQLLFKPRSDALRAMRATPGQTKAVALLEAGLAHRYYICTTPGLVTRAEVPFGWGLMEAHSEHQARVVVPAPAHVVKNLYAVRLRWTSRCAVRCSHQVRDLKRQLAAATKRAARP